MLDLFQNAILVQKKLNENGIPSCVIGGLAVAVWGESRVTRDIDFKILLQRNEAGKLLQSIKPILNPLTKDSEEKIRKTGILFSQNKEGLKFDFLCADTPFDEQVINRAIPIDVGFADKMIVCSAEDLVLYKMISTRPKDRGDIPDIIKRQKKNLNHKYVRHWLTEFEKALDDSTLLQEYKRLIGK